MQFGALPFPQQRSNLRNQKTKAEVDKYHSERERQQSETDNAYTTVKQLRNVSVCRRAPIDTD